jgi:hypothetical protein
MRARGAHAQIGLKFFLVAELCTLSNFCFVTKIQKGVVDPGVWDPFPQNIEIEGLAKTSDTLERYIPRQ